MILIWNHAHGDMYAFPDLAAYEQFARDTEGDDRTVWEDVVYDVGAGGKATDDNNLDNRALCIRVTR